MSNRHVAALADFLRHAAEPAWAAGLSDGELLERFLARREEPAFAALVRRHGPTVLGVCRRILHHPQDAEDAFQATFLVLVRSANSIRKRQSVGSWLYGVARRVAVRARADRTRRRQVEERAPARAAAGVSDEAAGREFRSVLDEEVRRLPERCRLPFVMCYLEGKTNAEAARLLGCPKGTVLSRLAHARDLLRGRLQRRGLGLSAALAGLTAEGARASAVPARLVTATARAALVLVGGAGAGTIPARVVELTERMVKAMAATKLKLAVLTMLAAGLLGGGAGVLAYRARAADRATESPPVAQQAAHADEQAQPPKPRAAEPDAAAARARDRRKELEAQHDELQDRVQKLEQTLLEMADRRAKEGGSYEVTAHEENIRRLERQQALERERERADMKALEERIRELRLEVKKNPKVKDELAELRAELEQEDQHWKRAEERRSNELLKERQALETIQEQLRQLARRNAIERGTIERELDAAEDRLRQLDGRLLDPEAPPQSGRDLDRKLDRVLQELAELRRDLQHRPPGEP